MQEFRDVLHNYQLFDFGFKGLSHTYDNKREGRNNVKVRLDRAVADDNWRNFFTDYQVTHLISPCSDHCPILLKFDTESQSQHKTKCLRYEIFWEREAALQEVINSAWEDSGGKQNLGDIKKALGKVMRALHSWSKAKCINVGRELDKARKKLSDLLVANTDHVAIRQETDNIDELLYRKEMLWLRRSRVNWLKKGDCNTNFFHSRAVWRAKKNKISKLRDAGCTVHSTASEMEQMATEYFQSICTANLSLDQSRVTRLL
ncbi:hypothetical protein OsI_33012 [Oryza sativa Indica Group]|jgi:hypothetical protein|uniref:Uncharacterized protein n=1 Tax=Oryza sativa subsp. indica TaxID=39946 RepID=B8BG42_ORYSI|nr:hypothetical protein OsI_33012 [Oryza sativa Indica Group]